MEKRKVVYVVTDAYAGSFSCSGFYAVFSTEEKALEECGRLAARWKKNADGELGEDKGVCKRGPRKSPWILGQPGESWKGFAIIEEGVSISEAYHVHKVVLDGRSCGECGLWQRTVF